MQFKATVEMTLTIKIPVIVKHDRGDFEQPPYEKRFIDSDRKIVAVNHDNYEEVNLENLEDHIEEFIGDME